MTKGRDIVKFAGTGLRCCVAMLALAMSWSHPGIAENLSGAAISDAIESRADEILARYLPKDQFIVQVTAEANKNTGVRIPYLGSAPNSEYLKTTSIKDLINLTSSVKINLIVGSAVTQENKDSLVQIFTTSLRLRPPPTDQIIISQLNLLSASGTGGRDEAQSRKLLDDLRVTNQQKETITKERGDLKNELLAAQSAISRLNETLNQQKATQSKERGDLKSELIASKSENSRLSQSINQKSAELVSYLSAAKKSNTPQQSFLKNLKANAHYLILATLVFTALTLIAAAFRQSGGKVSGSISEIATSLEEGMRSFGSSSGRGEEGPKAEVAAQTPGTQSFADRGVGSPYQLKRLDELRTILQTSVTPKTQLQLTMWISSLVADQTRIPKAVVSLELIPADAASAIYKKLGSADQDAIVKFMRSGEFPRSKIEMMLEAGEELLTRILADSLTGSRQALKSDVAERILKLSTSDLASVFVELRPENYPRLMLYMDSKTIHLIMKQLRRQNQDAYRAIVSQLGRVPEAELNTEADRDLIVVLDRAISKVKDDSFRSYMNFFQEIVEQSDDDQKNDILFGIEAANPDVADKLRRAVISFSSLFRLPKGVQSEILASMGNRDVAGLMFGISNEEASNLLPCVSLRRRQIILDELKMLQDGDQENLRSINKKAKAAIIQKIRAVGTDLAQETAA